MSEQAKFGLSAILMTAVAVGWSLLFEPLSAAQWLAFPLGAITFATVWLILPVRGAR